MAIVDDANKLIGDVEGFVNDLQRDEYNYILLFLDVPDNLPKSPLISKIPICILEGVFTIIFIIPSILN